ncbi:MAG: hypothetical protein EBV06_06280 [Planctomycetia bacterium]|nr:hypothetical protein [Planctomycetia bacterium]
MRSALLALVLVHLAVARDDTPPASPPLTVIDVTGKELKLKGWTFFEGTRRLGWLVDPNDKDTPPPKSVKPKGKRPPRVLSFGPEALVIRDANKFNFAEGVLAFVPLDRLRSIDYDSEKRSVTVKAVVSGKAEDDVELTGSTLYKMLNKVTLEADVDKGALGVAAVTYQGGLNRGGIRGLRFSPESVQPFKPGRASVIETADKDLKRTYQVSDLMPLYRLADGREVLSSTLLFKKTLRLDVSKLASLTQSGEDSEETVWTVTPKDGEAGTLTLLTSGTIEEQNAVLVGLVGRVPWGYRLFPVRRIKSIMFDATEVPKGTPLRQPTPVPDDK